MHALDAVSFAFAGHTRMIRHSGHPTNRGLYANGELLMRRTLVR